MKHRRLAPALVAATITAVIALSGCSPMPEPEPTPTPVFASEEEAFKAAEETYRAYVEADNAKRAGEDSPDPHEWLIGSALEFELEQAKKLTELGLQLTGTTSVASFEQVSVDLDSTPVVIVALVCLDVSKNVVRDESGADVTPDDLVPRFAQKVTLHADAANIVIARSARPEESTC